MRRDAVNQTLWRLARGCELLRAGRAVDFLPVKGKFGALAPEVAKMLQEWANQRCKTVVGHGAAAKAPGLAPQSPVHRVVLTTRRSRKLGAQTVELNHAPPWVLRYSEQTAGDVIRVPAWLGPSGSEEAPSCHTRKLPATALQDVVTPHWRLTAWPTSQRSNLVNRD